MDNDIDLSDSIKNALKINGHIKVFENIITNINRTNYKNNCIIYSCFIFIIILLIIIIISLINKSNINNNNNSKISHKKNKLKHSLHKKVKFISNKNDNKMIEDIINKNINNNIKNNIKNNENNIQSIGSYTSKKNSLNDNNDNNQTYNFRGSYMPIDNSFSNNYSLL